MGVVKKMLLRVADSIYRYAEEDDSNVSAITKPRLLHDGSYAVGEIMSFYDYMDTVGATPVSTINRLEMYEDNLLDEPMNTKLFRIVKAAYVNHDLLKAHNPKKNKRKFVKIMEGHKPVTIKLQPTFKIRKGLSTKKRNLYGNTIVQTVVVVKRPKY